MPTFTTILDQDFSANSDTSYGAAGNTTAVPGPASGINTQPWKDRLGNEWKIVSGKAVASSGAGFSGNVIDRPAGETYNEQRIKVYLSNPGTNTPFLVLRESYVGGVFHGYYAGLNSFTTPQISLRYGGTVINLATGTAISPMPAALILTFTCTVNATAGFDLTFTVEDAAAPGTFIQTVTVTGDTNANVSAQGVYAISHYFASSITRAVLSAVTAAIVPGAASFSTSDGTSVSMACTAATGGVGPYTYQWYRSTTSGFTPGGGNILSGKTSLSLADSTAVSGTTYYYKCVTTDAVSGTASSNQAVGTLWGLPVKYGAVGDSITEGYLVTVAMPTSLGLSLSRLLTRAVAVTNRGLSSTTTTSWLIGGSLLGPAITAFTSAGVTHVGVTLGTNDCRSSAPIAAATYGSNLAAICASLAGAGFAAVLHYPPYPVPGSFGLWDETSPGYAQAYCSQIDSLVNGTTILRGDRLAFTYFAEHMTELQDGIHPSEAGAANLGQLQAEALKAIFSPPSGGGASLSRVFGGL